MSENSKAAMKAHEDAMNYVVRTNGDPHKRDVMFILCGHRVHGLCNEVEEAEKRIAELEAELKDLKSRRATDDQILHVGLNAAQKSSEYALELKSRVADLEVENNRIESDRAVESLNHNATQNQLDEAVQLEEKLKAVAKAAGSVYGVLRQLYIDSKPVSYVVRHHGLRCVVEVMGDTLRNAGMFEGKSLPRQEDEG